MTNLRTDTIREAAERLAPTLLNVSHTIHADPELRFNEHRACRTMVDALRAHNYDVEVGVAEMPTAFRASVGHGDPTVAILCEYDAIEGLGHACGHNIIAAAGLGAFLLAGDVLSGLGREGRVVVIGTPAEEGGGGKVRLLEAGVFDDVDIAMMVHPSTADRAARICPARAIVEASYVGKAAHAGAAPYLGRNALDAVTLAQVAIGLLRQQLEDDARVHGIVTEGGEAANTIPDRASLRLQLRSPRSSYLRERLQPAVENCLRAAALATGTELQLAEPVPAYAAMRPNATLEALVEQQFRAIGRVPKPSRESGPWGSTDMGNVSHKLPAMHPFIRVSDEMLEHTRGAVAAAASTDGDRAAVDGAVLLATCALRLITESDLMSAVHEDFERFGA